MSEDAQTIFDGPEAGRRPEPMPERIGHYQVEGRLGAGGMGEVFLAWDERLKRRIAVKRLRQDIGLPMQQRERFRLEAQMPAGLSHPSIVQIHDVVADGPDNAIVMEYVKGRTLADRLASGRLEMPEILQLACEIAEGLAEAHEAGLVHRDLKAANVMVTDSGHAKILDFGLARPVVRSSGDPGLTQQGFVLGTCLAMSPEQARGEEVDARSDLFSFGSLVHEMLTGRPPFRGTDPLDSMQKVLNDEPVDPLLARPDLPPEAAGLLRRLLKKNRDERPGSTREVVEILNRVRNGHPAPPAALPEKSLSDLLTKDAPAFPSKAGIGWPQTWTRRRVLVIGAVLLLIAAGAVAFYLKIRSTRPLEVAVIMPERSPEDGDLNIAAGRVHRAALDALTELAGIEAKDPSDILSDFQGSPIEAGKGVGAEQILSFSLTREDGTAAVTFQLSEVASQKVLRTKETKVALGGERRRELTNAVRDQVHKIFPDYERRPGTSSLTPREEDLDAFLWIQQRVDEGEVRRQNLEQLEKIMLTSPRFPGAPILASRIAHNLFLSHRDPRDLDRASAFARRAETIDPEDPRPLRLQFQIALTSEQPVEAETILDQLEQLHPGDPDILPLRAELAESQDNLDQAAELLTEAIEQNPSWQNRYLLANLEARRGRIDEAREQIDAILLEAPENVWAREAKGYIELTYGKLAEAERIYKKLVDEVPDRALNNLGTVQLMKGDYAEAAVTYRKVFDDHPEYVLAMINLAEAYIELGNKRAADELYEKALDSLEERRQETSLTPSEGLQMAHCLARLGRPQEAVEIARVQLERNPEDAELQLQSVLIYSLASDLPSARKAAKNALAGGFKARWFTGSVFQWLYEDSEVGPLLEEDR